MRKFVRGNGIAITLVLALVLPPGVLAQSTTQPAAPQPVVVPGLAIGQWSLDRTLADYIFDLGVPDVRPSGTDLAFRPELVETSWAAAPLAVIRTPASNAVWALGTSLTGARTVEQVGVGSSEQQVTAAYDAPSMALELPLRSRTLIYDGRGVAFELPFVPATGQYGAAGRVFVFRPGQARAIWRLP